MMITRIYSWRLNNPPAETQQSNTTETNIEKPQSFNTHDNDVEKLSRTTFDDAIETTTQAFELSNTPHKVQNDMDMSGSINEVLARPYLVDDIHLSVPGTALASAITIPPPTQVFVSTIDLPSRILADPNKITKLEYFRYFTADMKIRIETNAQPYMSGKFWIFYNPYPDLKMQGTELTTASLPCITSYPGIEYDINQMSNAEISIPFISYERAFDLEDPQDYCRLYISQLTTIKDVTTETNLRMRVYGWFENIKVFGASSHSNAPTAYIQNKIKEYQQILNAQIQINNNAEQGSGPISGIASSVSKAAGALKGLPVIGEMSGTVSFVSDIVSKVASIFGFSRPTSTSEVCKIANIPGHGYTYANAVDEAVMLATRPDNELGPQAGVFQTDMDEMEIEYVARNPAVIDVISYTNSSDNGAWLRNIPCAVAPYVHQFDNTGAYLQQIYAPSCGEYISQLFRLWRGTVCFKISLAKTPFHNGRLLLSFDPSNNIVDTPITRIGKAYTTILDLSENSSVIIKIPFLSKFDYLNTNVPDSTSTHYPLDFLSFGTFSIGALAPLLGPETVADSVDIVVWKWFEDLELAQPSGIVTYALGDSTSSEVQINIMNRDEENVIVFNNPIRDTSLDHPQNCIGEKTTNLRSMLRMHRRVYSVSNNSQITPFRDIAGGGTSFTYFNSDYVTYLARMYRFFRGGFSVKLYGNSGTSLKTILQRRLQQPSPFYNKNSEMTPTHRTNPSLNPFHEIRIPFYSQTYRRVINNEYLNATSLDYTFPEVHVESDSSASYDLYVAGDDNLSYGWLIGPPMIALSII
jgi:hypothetical protein